MNEHTDTCTFAPSLPTHYAAREVAAHITDAARLDAVVDVERLKHVALEYGFVLDTELDACATRDDLLRVASSLLNANTRH